MWDSNAVCRVPTYIGRPDSSDARVSLKMLQNNMKQAQKKGKNSECGALQVPSGLGHTLYTTRASVALKVSMK